MSGTAIVRATLRLIAVAIAVAAVIDPAIAGRRRRDATVVVQPQDSAMNGASAQRAASVLGKRFAVVRTATAGADAFVAVGDRIPHGDEWPAPVFIVGPDTSAPRVTIARVVAPAEVTRSSHVAVEVRARASRAQGMPVSIALRANGVIVDRVTRNVRGPDDSVSATLHFVPSRSGAVALSATADLGGTRSDEVDALVDVRDRQWRVLFHDARPSWASTFVRRAVEADPRFVVTSRITTSWNVTTDAGRPPSRLDDRRALDEFDAVVIGAPEALSAADVDGLISFTRGRGGSVILLLDQRIAGSYDRLTGAAEWRSASTNEPLAVPSNRVDSMGLRAMNAAWPVALPAESEILAGDVARPIVWQTPSGAGRVVVSGALDAWRFRDSTESGFVRFWRATIAEAAAAAVPPLTVSVARPIARPGEAVDVGAVAWRLRLRPDAMPATASLAARMDSAGELRLWPAGVGQLEGRIRAPSEPGTYRVRVNDGEHESDAPLIVAATPAMEPAAPLPLLATWASAHGGSLVTDADIESLADRIEAALGRAPRLEVWHPMRAPWWIVPFTLALSAEWWLRRRRGLR